MLDHIDITSILFLDIETVSEKKSFSDLNEDLQHLWHIKAKALTKPADGIFDDEMTAQSYTDRAAIFAEYGKIVCISVGIVTKDPETKQLKARLKSFANDDEKILLEEFVGLLNAKYNNPERFYLCGHNIKEFDVPYICRRMLLNQMSFPRMLDVQGKKPWETKHLLDTLELWKFGDNKNYTSLKTLAAIFGFPSPKDDIDGSQVGGVYWNDEDLPRIATYCEKDVLAVIQLLLKMKLMPILEAEQITFVKPV